MDRKFITVVGAVVLCAAWFAYSFGWFDWSRAGADAQSDTVSANQTSDQEKKKVDAAQATQETAEPVDSATE
jgi:hypothetical protein